MIQFVSSGSKFETVIHCPVYPFKDKDLFYKTTSVYIADHIQFRKFSNFTTIKRNKKKYKGLRELIYD